MAEPISWSPNPMQAWLGLTASKPNLNFVPSGLWGYEEINYNDVTNAARELQNKFFEEYRKSPENFTPGVGLTNPQKAEVDFLEYAEKSGKLPDWWIKPAREYVQSRDDLSQFLTKEKDIESVGPIQIDYEGPKELKAETPSEYTKARDQEYLAQQQYLQSPEYLAAMKEANYRALGGLTVEEARDNIFREIGQQRDSLAQQGFNWSGSIPASRAAYYMADKLANAGVKSIYDLAPGKIEVNNPFGQEGTRETTGLINKRTGEAIPADYAFATMSDSGGIWGGTFEGDPGGTSYNIDFVNGTPVLSTQFQPNKKSSIERIAMTALPIALGYFLGPAGYGLSSTAAGAIAGGASGLLQGGDLEDVLKQAALGGALGYGKEALFGAGTAASDLAKIEGSMGTPGLLGSSNILDAINQAGVYGPDALAGASPGVFAGLSPELAAGNLGALEASMGAFTGPTLPPTNFEPVLVPGDNLLSSTLAQPPLSVEDIAGRLTPEATALMGSPTGPMLPQLPSMPTISGGQVTGPSLPDLVNYEEAAGNLLAGAQQNFANSGLTLADFMTPDTFVGPTMGDPTKAALYSDAGYGSTDAPIYDYSIPSGSLATGPDPSIAKGVGDIIKYAPGAGKAFVTTALTTLGLDPDLVNTIVGWNPSTTASATTQTSSGSNFLGPIIGGLLSRPQAASPSAPVTAGRPVDITSPIQSLLAPKLVQQRPVSLL